MKLKRLGAFEDDFNLIQFPMEKNSKHQDVSVEMFQPSVGVNKQLVDINCYCFFNVGFSLAFFSTKDLVDSLLYQIIRSKRLLADHIELLEQYHIVPDYDDQFTNKFEKFTFLRTLALLSVSVISMKLKR